jgi:hypothetical protein
MLFRLCFFRVISLKLPYLRKNLWNYTTSHFWNVNLPSQRWLWENSRLNTDWHSFWHLWPTCQCWGGTNKSPFDEVDMAPHVSPIKKTNIFFIKKQTPTNPSFPPDMYNALTTAILRRAWPSRLDPDSPPPPPRPLLAAAAAFPLNSNHIKSSPVSATGEGRCCERSWLRRTLLRWPCRCPLLPAHRNRNRRGSLRINAKFIIFSNSSRCRSRRI